MTSETPVETSLTASLSREYPKFAAKYWYSPMIAHWRGIEAAVLKSVLGQGLTAPALDLGCGDGIFSGEVWDKRPVASVGIDLSTRSVRRAALTKHYAELAVADATRLPFRDGAFSMVFSNSTIEHIPPVSSLLSEVKRVLEPGGRFLFTVPNHNLERFLVSSSPLTRFGLSGLAQRWARRRNRKLAHVHLHDGDRWTDLLEDAGMQVVLIQPYLSEEAVALWEFLRDINLGVGRYRAYAALKKVGASVNLLGEGIGPAVMSNLANRLLNSVQRWEQRASEREGACWLVIAERA